MDNKHYDEYQIINRHKIAFQTLMITVSLVLLNGIISDIYEWARPILQASIIVHISVGYFATRAIFKNAYFGMNEKKYYINLLFLLLWEY